MVSFLDKYDSHRFWLEYGKPQIQHFVKDYPAFKHGREDVFKILFPFIKDAETVLDCGCGQGYFIQFLLGLQPEKNVFGIDLSKDVIHMSKVKRRIVADASFIPFKEKSFDAVYFITVLQHLEDQLVSKIGSEVNRVLKDAGWCLIYEATDEVNKRVGFSMWIRSKKYYQQLLQMKPMEEIEGINYALAFKFSSFIPRRLRHIEPFFFIFKNIQNLEVFFSEMLKTRTKNIKLVIFKKKEFGNSK
jgi:ubiquinone/menaquinone biosynthesis C-methylase UbiE